MRGHNPLRQVVLVKHGAQVPQRQSQHGPQDKFAVLHLAQQRQARSQSEQDRRVHHHAVRQGGVPRHIRGVVRLVVRHRQAVRRDAGPRAKQVFAAQRHDEGRHLQHGGHEELDAEAAHAVQAVTGHAQLHQGKEEFDGRVGLQIANGIGMIVADRPGTQRREAHGQQDNEQIEVVVRFQLVDLFVPRQGHTGQAATQKDKCVKAVFGPWQAVRNVRMYRKSEGDE